MYIIYTDFMERESPGFLADTYKDAKCLIKTLLTENHIPMSRSFFDSLDKTDLKLNHWHAVVGGDAYIAIMNIGNPSEEDLMSYRYQYNIPLKEES